MKDEVIEALILVFVGVIIGGIVSDKMLLTNPTIIAAIIAATIACIFSKSTVRIATGQRNIAKSKLDLDLFEKKISIYDAIIKLYLFGREYFHNYIEDDTHPKADLIENQLVIIQNFRSKCIEYYLFFDQDDFLDDIKKYVDEWLDYIYSDFALPNEINPTKNFFLECKPQWVEFTKRMTERIKVNYPDI